MITNIHRAKASGDIQRYIRYTIAPERDQKSEHYKFGERTLSMEADYLSFGSTIERNKTSRNITKQIEQWNEEKRVGKKKPKSPAVLGVISFTSSDTEKFYSTTEDGIRYLDHSKIIAIAREAVAETMGENRPMYFALHGDKDHLHVHFAASMVDSNGKIFDASKTVNEEGKTVSVREFRRWEITNEKLEIKHDLERVLHRKAFEHEGEHRQSQVKRHSNAVIHLAEKGELAPSVDVGGRLETVYNECNKQFDKFLELAEKYGLKIKPNMSETKVNGLAFAVDGMDSFIKASAIGNKYKWNKLEKDLNYDSERDFTKLAELKAIRAENTATDRSNNTATKRAETITIDTRTLKTVDANGNLERDSRGRFRPGSEPDHPSSQPAITNDKLQDSERQSSVHTQNDDGQVENDDNSRGYGNAPDSASNNSSGLQPEATTQRDNRDNRDNQVTQDPERCTVEGTGEGNKQPSNHIKPNTATDANKAVINALFDDVDDGVKVVKTLDALNKMTKADVAKAKALGATLVEVASHETRALAQAGTNVVESFELPADLIKNYGQTDYETELEDKKPQHIKDREKSVFNPTAPGQPQGFNPDPPGRKQGFNPDPPGPKLTVTDYEKELGHLSAERDAKQQAIIAGVWKPKDDANAK